MAGVQESSLLLERAMENITEEQLATATEIAEQLSGDVDVGTWVQKNLDFHSIFHRVTSSARLADFLVSLERVGGVFVAQAQRLDPEIRRRAVAGHDRLITAFQDQDLEGACEIQFNHVNLPLDASEAAR